MSVLETIDIFAKQAHSLMRWRLREKANVWGDGWRSGVYTDEDNEARLRAAVETLVFAVKRSRHPEATSPEVAEPMKRAADVANQAFMLADPLRRNEPKP